MVSYKFKHVLSCEVGIALRGMYPRKTKTYVHKKEIYKDICNRHSVV